MPSKELIEKVARALYRSDHGNEFGFHLKDVAAVYKSNAEAAISTILAALQEPTEGMLEECSDAWRYGQVLWPKMLAASALGEQSE